MAKHEQTCSFCNRKKSETQILIAGIDSHICEVCVAQASQIINDEIHQKQSKYKFSLAKSIKPKEIVKFLDQYVIGQVEAKRYCLLQFIIIIKD